MIMLRKIYLFAVFALISAYSYAQTGTLTGLIADAMTGEPIPLQMLLKRMVSKLVGPQLILMVSIL